MSLPYYEAFLKIRPSTPNDYYREQFQALINAKWEETTTKYLIKAETEVGSFIFEDTEVRINHALDKSTGIKQGDDFREIIFKEITHNAPKGLYYKFDNNYWLTYNTDEYNRTSKNIIVRRCNNWLRYYDKTDGALIEIPCILDYDATAPTPQVDNDIITPNNRITIIVQSNEKTTNIVQTNTRFIFGQRPFRVSGYNNYMQNNIINSNSALLYIDAYLDEISPYDNLKEEIAYNFGNKYQIIIDQKDFNQITGYTTQLSATVLDGNTIVDRNITWISSNTEVLTINEEGYINLVGSPGDTVTVTAQLGNNTAVTDSINITIVESTVQDPIIIIKPLIQELAQNQSIILTANVYTNNIKQDDIVMVNPSGASIESYDLTQVSTNTFKLNCNKVSQIPLLLTFTANNLTETMAINLVSMF